jgi:hypothetical protein
MKSANERLHFGLRANYDIVIPGVIRIHVPDLPAIFKRDVDLFSLVRISLASVYQLRRCGFAFVARKSNSSVMRGACVSLRGRQSRGTRDRNDILWPPVTEGWHSRGLFPCNHDNFISFLRQAKSYICFVYSFRRCSLGKPV